MSQRFWLSIGAVALVACGTFFPDDDDPPPVLTTEDAGLPDVAPIDAGQDAPTFRAALYIVGGLDSTNVSTRVITGMLEGGRITWKAPTSFGTTFTRGGAFVHGGYLWAVGGDDGVLVSVPARRAAIATGLTSWENVMPLGQPRFDVGVAVQGDEVYVIGGNVPTGTVATVERGTLSQQGVAWAAGPSLPAPRRIVHPGIGGAEIAVAGGYADTLPPTCGSEVLVLRQNQWRLVGTLGTPRFGVSVAQAGDLLYAVGGRCGTTTSSALEVFRIGVDGGVALVNSALLRERRWGHATAVLDGRLYVFGGHPDLGPSSAEVVSTPLDGTGDIGLWRDEEPLPEPLAEFGFAVQVLPP